MFIIVLSLNENGYTKMIGDLLSNFNPIYSYGLSGALFANLINNIPMSVLYSNIITGNGKLDEDDLDQIRVKLKGSRPFYIDEESGATEEQLREDIAKFNKDTPVYKQITSIYVSENPFPRTTTKKIIRRKVEEFVANKK